MRIEPLVVNIKTASATQTLPKLCVSVDHADYLAGGETSTSATRLAPVTGAPTASEIQFTGTTGTPSDQVTLSADPPAGSLLIVWAAVQGAVPAYP